MQLQRPTVFRAACALVVLLVAGCAKDKPADLVVTPLPEATQKTWDAPKVAKVRRFSR